MKIGERTVNNALFSVVSGMLPLALSFFFWPYIVSSLGEASYGILALVGSIIGYFALLDLGLGTAVVKFVSEYAGQQDKGKVQEVISVASALFFSAGVLGLFLIVVFTRLLATRWLKIPPELMQTATHVFYAAAPGFFFTMLMTLFSSIINGLNRYDISSTLLAGMGAVTTLGSVLLLFLGFGLRAVVWLNVAAPAMMSLVQFMVIRWLLPEVSLNISFSRPVFIRILKFGLYSSLGRISSVIVRQAAPILIGILLGVSAVTYYIIPFTILNRLTSLLGRIGMVILPTISELQGQRQSDKIHRLYLTSSRIILSFALSFMIPLLIFGMRFLTLWMGPEFASQGGRVLFVISIAVLIDLCTNVPSFVANGLGRPQVCSLAAFSQAMLFLMLMVPGAFIGGIVGVAVAYALSQVIVVPIAVTVVNCRVVGLPLSKLMNETYLRPLMAGVITALPLFFVPQSGIHNIFLLLGVMGCGVGLYLAVALLLGVYQKHERGILKEYLGTVIARFQLGRGV